MEKMNELNEIQLTSHEYISLVLDEPVLRSLTIEEVYWQDYTKINPNYEIKYYKTMVPEIPLEVCKECCRFFILDEYEFEFLKTKKCPFCKTLDPRCKDLSEDNMKDL